MEFVISRKFYFLLLFVIVTAVDDSRDLFIISPGDGEEFMYSPVGVNATIHCAVNSTILEWTIHVGDSDLSFSNRAEKPDLDLRGIFQSGLSTSADGIRSSSVILAGSRQKNNDTKICCQSNLNGLKENCTTLVLYGKVNTKLLMNLYNNNHHTII